MQGVMRGRNATAMDEIPAVDELHALSFKDLESFLLSQESLIVELRFGKADQLTVDLENLASRLPLHLIAYVAARGKIPRLQYWLRCVRLLHTLSVLGLGHPKLAQVLFEGVKMQMQILDLVIFMLIVLANLELEEGRGESQVTVLHASLVPCSLYLLKSFISGDWVEIASVLLAHPKVDVFMDAGFDAVRRDIDILQVKVRTLSAKLSSKRTTFASAERVAHIIALQCEASLQVLQQLCGSPTYRDRAIGHEELCKSGGILKLVLAVLRLQLPPALARSRALKATVSRSKANALLMMLYLCECDECSFLDKVAAEPCSMQLAEQVAHEVVLLVKGALLEDPRRVNSEEEEMKHPMGMLHVMSLRLVDILSDDSGFRNLVMDQIAPDLATMLAVTPTKFQARWCGGAVAEDLARWELDVTLIYDPFKAGEEACMGPSVKDEALSPPEFEIKPLVATAYQLRATLLVKLFGNFQCFVSDLLPANEKDRFLKTFLECLYSGPLNVRHPAFFLSLEQTAVRICENIYTLYDYVLMLTSDVVADDDLILFSDFADELHHKICPFSSCVADSPMLGFVCDGHGQRLCQWKKVRERSARWKLLDQFPQPDSPSMEPTGVAEATREEIKEMERVPGSEVLSPKELPGTPGEAIPQVEQATIPVEVSNVSEEEEEVDGGLPDEDGDAFEKVTTTLTFMTQTVVVEKEKGSGNATGTDPEDGEKGEQECRGAIVTEQEDDGEAEEDSWGAIFLEEEDEEEGEEDSWGALIMGREVEGKGEQESGGPKATEPEDKDKGGEQESGGPTVGGLLNSGIGKHTRDREAHDNEHRDESQPKKRKGNDIMNDKQVSVIEAALQSEPDMQRYSQAIEQWTTQLNLHGPEILHQQLKDWLNNRRARIAKGERNKQHQVEGDVFSARGDKARHTRSVSVTNMDSSKEASPSQPEDDQDYGELGPATVPSPAPQALAMPGRGGEPDSESGANKYEVGQVVSIQDRNGDEMGVGVVAQIGGLWRGHNLKERNLSLVQVTELKVATATNLPFPFALTCTSFEDAQTLVDAHHMQVVTAFIPR